MSGREEKERAEKVAVESFRCEYDSTVSEGVTLLYRGEKVREFKKGGL